MSAVWKKSINRRRIVAALFVLLLAAPGTAAFFKPADIGAIAAIENRAAARWPSWPQRLDDINGYARQVDAYLEDRFGFRERLIAVNLWLTRQINLSTSGRDAIIGKEGWLFYADGGALEMHMGRAPFRSGQAAAWLDGAERLQRDVADRGGAFALMIPPQKASVYSEYMPDFIKAGRGASRLDILTEGAPARGLALADARARLLKKKDDAPLYYQSDTHWTAFGAYEGYLAFMDAVNNKLGVSAPVLPPDRLKFGTRSFSGDLARMLGQQEQFSETAPSLAIRDQTRFEDGEVENFAYGSFKTRIITMDAPERPSLLIIGDSFSYAMLPYLRESFSRIVFTHHHTGTFDRAVLDEYPADVVLLQMVEVMLIHPLPTPAAPAGDTAAAVN
ncbi:MAG: hypothetical protein AAGD92_11900 [Pseudomonadota bacterium]